MAGNLRDDGGGVGHRALYVRARVWIDAIV